MANIGIIGAGVSSLHLGIGLRNAGIGATLYTPQTAQQIESGPIQNTVAHMDDTIRREREMDIEFWDESNSRVCRTRHYTVGEPGAPRIAFVGALGGDERCVDYRIYLPRLMREFEKRGGTIVPRDVTAANVDELCETYDLLAIGTGKKNCGFGDFFPRIDALSKHREAQRILCAGIYAGIDTPEPLGVTFNISIGHGEVIELPIETRQGPRTVLLFENRPEGELTDLASIDYAADAAAFNQRVLDVLALHYPSIFDRVDKHRFGLMGADALLQGQVKPITRESWAEISEGCYAVAIGDLRCTMDPLTGQGANLASYGACKLTDHIVAAGEVFDSEFCRDYENQVRYRVAGVVNFNNAILEPAEHTRELIHAMAHDSALADDFSERFARPETIWFDILKDAETCRRHIERFNARSRAA